MLPYFLGGENKSNKKVDSSERNLNKYPLTYKRISINIIFFLVLR